MSNASVSIRACKKAKDLAGGPSALARGLAARGLKISSQAVSRWDRVPADRVLDVEGLTGVSRYELRPDVFGAAPAQTPVAAPDNEEASR